MGLLRLFLLLAIAWFVWRWLLRAAFSAPSTPRPAGEPEDYQPLTKCQVCGAHIPQPANGAARVCERCRSR
jgi:hypothetical protein